VTSLVQEIRAACREIQPLSHSVTRLLMLMGDGKRSAAQVGQVVEADPALTLNLLRTVNSAAFGLRQPVTSAAAAVAYLGDRLVLAVAINCAAGRVFQRPLEGYAGPAGALWRHCLRTALASREIAGRCVRPPDPDTAFTAGILHDVGKAVLSRFLLPTMRDALPEADVHDYLELETKAVGMDHAEAGELLADHWELPAPLRAAIRYHHHPAKAPDGARALCFTVHLADALAIMGGSGTGADGLAYLLVPEWKDEVHLERHDLEALLFKVDTEFEKTTAALAATVQESNS
jgi:HD-like signal output (HDOD) protein